ncbi:MAG: hypothetical protein Q7K65_05565 [Candidatus Buchananbacteria bacterium]|nr:hypothetical protein [Candidatus Buchananbacteria bacterium]
MIIKVENISAEKFSELVAFIDEQEVKKPTGCYKDDGSLMYGDVPEKIKPVFLRDIKQDDNTRLYSFNIIILQLIRVDLFQFIHPDVEVQRCGVKEVDIRIPRSIIDGILDILGIFPRRSKVAFIANS